MLQRSLQYPTIGQAWEASLELFLDPIGLNRYDSRGVPCVEVEDLFMDISHPHREPRVSVLYPKEFHPLIDEFTSRLLEPQFGQTSIINDRLFRWKSGDGQELNQLSTVVEMIRVNPDLRYTIIGLWSPALDLFSETPVGPIALYFRRRSDALNLTLVTRTLDAIVGAVQLIVGFANLQQHISRMLGLSVGALRVLALSYHLHDMDLPRVRSMLNGGGRRGS
ncbi:thymidylate synthase [Nonomuraea rubra]